MTQFPSDHFGEDGGVRALRVAGTKNQGELAVASVLQQLNKESLTRSL
jgi:hypothetical protein